MKNIVAAVLKKIYSVCMLAVTIVTLAIIAMYITCFIIGGSTATALEAFIYFKIFPVMFISVIVLAFIGIIYVYLTGFWTFRFDVQNKNADNKKRIE